MVSVDTFVSAGASGAVLSTVSTYSCCTSGLLLPAVSVACTVIIPAGTSRSEVTVKLPVAPTLTVRDEPSGKPTVTSVPGSAVPVNVTRPVSGWVTISFVVGAMTSGG